jgi:hypothetical protein
MCANHVFSKEKIEDFIELMDGISGKEVTICKNLLAPAIDV